MAVGKMLGRIDRKEITIEEIVMLKLKNQKIDWDKLICTRYMNKEFIIEFCDILIEYNTLFAYQELPEEVMAKVNRNKNCGYAKWDYIGRYQKLSEQFIETHFKKLSLYNICKYQTLSEKFINKYWRKFKKMSKYHYRELYGSQELSEEFILKKLDEINNPADITAILFNYKIILSEETKNILIQKRHSMLGRT